MVRPTPHWLSLSTNAAREKYAAILLGLILSEWPRSQMSCQHYSAILLHVWGQFTLPGSKTTITQHLISSETYKTIFIYLILIKKIEEITGELIYLTVPKSSNILCSSMGHNPWASPASHCTRKPIPFCLLQDTLHLHVSPPTPWASFSLSNTQAWH